MELTKASNVSKANRSFRWTAIGELSAKVLAPLINMVLARFISPAAFGIVATLSVVTGLATTLSESGFARYVQQHQFESEEERKRSNRTSLTSSLIFGIILFAAIAIWRFPIASLVGAEGYEPFLIVAAASIPFHSIIAVESAILKRDFRFRMTAFVRIGSAIITAAIQIALAVLGQGLQALTWGALISAAFQALILFFFLKDKKIFGFSLKAFRQSFADNFLFLMDGMCVWLAAALDVLLLGKAFGDNLVGVYKLAFNTEKGLVALLGAIFSPVLISLISKFSSESEHFHEMLHKYQKAVAFLAVPMGIGMFMFRNGITNIFLGSGWEAAIPIFGFFALFDCLKTPISDFISTLMSARGKPIGTLLAHVLYLPCIALCCIFASNLGFDLFVVLRASCTLILVLSYTLLCKPLIGISGWSFYKNLLAPLAASAIMAVACLPFVTLSNGIPMTIIGVLVGFLVYVGTMRILFPKSLSNFLSILLDKDLRQEQVASNEVHSHLSKGRLKKISKPLTRLYHHLPMIAFAIPLLFSGSLAASASTSLQSFASAFDICYAASRASQQSLSMLKIELDSESPSSVSEYLTISRSYASTKSHWTSLYNFYAIPSEQEDKIFNYLGENHVVTTIKPPSTWITNYSYDEAGHPRLETMGLYTMFERNEAKISGNNAIYISMSLADKILKEGETYSDLIDSGCEIMGANFSIANIIINSDATCFYDTYLNTYGDFVITGSSDLFKKGGTFVALFTNQPFELNDYLKVISGLETKNNVYAKCYFADKNYLWEESIQRSEKIQVDANNYENKARFSFSKESILGVALSASLFIALIATIIINQGRGNPFKGSFFDALFQSSAIFVCGGGAGIIATLLIRYYYRYWLYYSLSFGVITICVSLLPLLIYFGHFIIKSGSKRDA